MAKIKKRRLSWLASSSSQVIGYKLYWSEAGEVNYDSKCVALGNVTEVTLPDDVDSFTPGYGPIELGISAVDELGNESDIVTVTAPYHFSVPKAPKDLHIETLKDFHTTQGGEDESDAPQSVDLLKNVG
jgi:hypothetical protein